MPLPAMPVRSAQDATLNFDYLSKRVIVDTAPAIAARSEALTAAKNVYTNVAPNKVIYDPRGLFSEGLYHVPAKGVYMAMGAVHYSGELGAKNIALASILVSGVEQVRGTGDIAPEADEMGLTAGGLVSCVAGDTIGLYTLNNVTGGAALSIFFPSHNRLSVYRVA